MEDEPKKTNFEKKIEEEFNLPEEPKSIAEATSQALQLFKDARSLRTESYDNDVDLVKQNIRDTLERSDGILENLQRLALTSESPRAYEVLCNLIRTIVECNERLIVIYERCQKIESGSNMPKPDNTSEGKVQTINNTAYFIGTPTELSKKYGDRFNNQIRKN